MNYKMFFYLLFTSGVAIFAAIPEIISVIKDDEPKVYYPIILNFVVFLIQIVFIIIFVRLID